MGGRGPGRADRSGAGLGRGRRDGNRRRPTPRSSGTTRRPNPRRRSCRSPGREQTGGRRGPDRRASGCRRTRERRRARRPLGPRQFATAPEASSPGHASRPRRLGGATIPTQRDRPPARPAARARPGTVSPSERRNRPCSSRRPGAGKPSPLHRWLLVVVPLLVITTVAWRYRRSSMQEYPLIAEKGRNEGFRRSRKGISTRPTSSSPPPSRPWMHWAGPSKTPTRSATPPTKPRSSSTCSPRLWRRCSTRRAEPIPTSGRPSSRPSTRDERSSIDSIDHGRARPGRHRRATRSQYGVFPRAEPAISARGDARPDRIGVIDLTGFQLFELAPPHVGDHVTFGARLAVVRVRCDRDKSGDPARAQERRLHHAYQGARGDRLAGRMPKPSDARGGPAMRPRTWAIVIVCA